MTNKSKIPTFIALFILVVGIIAGIFLVKNGQNFRLGASPSSAPQDVRISNITDSSFTVSWTTAKATSGVVKWGKSAANLDQPVNDELPNPGFIHSVTIKPVSAESTYYFDINIEDQNNTNNGVPWEVTSGPTLAQPTGNDIISGSVLTSTGETVKNSLVYITVGGGSLLSTITSQNGSWLIPISSARSKDLTSLITIDEAQTLVEISVNAGPDGISTAQVYPQSAKPLPPMVLGQVHDYKNLAASTTGDNPAANIDLPTASTSAVSGFNVGSQAPAPQAKSVTLDSVTEGETINTVDPEFFGKGPSGTSVTITVESDNPMTDVVTIPKNETWSWSPPAGLDPGSHTVTVTWRDTQGILRTLTKSFVVSASDGPAFVSTPSATLEPTETPIPTIPEETETPVATATPVSGDLTPTVLLFMMGIGVISFAIILWKRSEI
jgi:hypothetical protein